MRRGEGADLMRSGLQCSLVVLLDEVGEGVLEGTGRCAEAMGGKIGLGDGAPRRSTTISRVEPSSRLAMTARAGHSPMKRSTSEAWPVTEVTRAMKSSTLS